MNNEENERVEKASIILSEVHQMLEKVLTNQNVILDYLKTIDFNYKLLLNRTFPAQINEPQKSNQPSLPSAEPFMDEKVEKSETKSKSINFLPKEELPQEEQVDKEAVKNALIKLKKFTDSSENLEFKNYEEENNFEEEEANQPKKPTKNYTDKKISVSQKVIYKEDSKPIALAQVKIFKKDSKQLEQKKLTNNVGKWIISLSPGEYVVTIAKGPAPDRNSIAYTQDIVVPESKDTIELETLKI